jgi:chromosome segregation ATPase
VAEAERKTDEIGKSVAAVAARCESVEALEERTRALGPELEQRHHAIREATEDLERASELRKDAASAAQQMKEQAKKLTGALATTGEQVAQMNTVAQELEDRTARLQSVEKRLMSFEERLARWDSVEKQLERALEQLSVRQGTVESLRSDFDRMFALAEKTVADVREISGAHREIEESRNLLADVKGKLAEIRDTAKALDERKRQMAKAEERLARAEALLVDVRSGVEALEGQKAVVDQAVEKTSSLRILLKQAEAAVSRLKDERELSTRVRYMPGSDRPAADPTDYVDADGEAVAAYADEAGDADVEPESRAA